MRSSVGVGGPPDQRQAAAMNIEAGDAVHHRLIGDVDRRIRLRQDVGERIGRRPRDENRFDGPVLQIDEPPHDKAALRDEQAEVEQLIGSRNVTIAAMRISSMDATWITG
jgi:hypothetical protein